MCETMTSRLSVHIFNVHTPLGRTTSAAGSEPRPRYSRGCGPLNARPVQIQTPDGGPDPDLDPEVLDPAL